MRSCVVCGLSALVMVVVTVFGASSALGQGTAFRPDTLFAEIPSVPVVAPLPQAELALKRLTMVMMRSRDFGQRLEAHQRVEAALTQLLKRPESYDYRFDSLVSISRVAPADQSFRVYTWMLIDPSGNHTYGGLVQRRVPRPGAPTAYDYYVISLRDRVDMVRQVETTPLTDTTWLGALYYHPRNSPHGVLSYQGEFYRPDPIKGKLKREKVTYYALLGVNNHDARTNYKIVELIHFDARDPMRVHFGIPVLYFGPTPRMRAVFKYADNGSFSLNYALVMEGKKKVPMIVFDHLAAPDKKLPDQLWAYGSDGTQDGLKFFDRIYEMRKGFFAIQHNVIVYDPLMEKYDPEQVKARSEREREKLRQQGIPYQADRKRPKP